MALSLMAGTASGLFSVPGFTGTSLREDGFPIFHFPQPPQCWSCRRAQQPTTSWIEGLLLLGFTFPFHPMLFYSNLSYFTLCS